MIDKRCTRWLLIYASAGGCIAASAVLLLLAWHLTICFGVGLPMLVRD